MYRFSIKGRRSLSILPGLVVGIVTGMLIVSPEIRLASAPSNSNPFPSPSEINRLSPGDLETLALTVLSTLHEKRGLAANLQSGAEKESGEQPENSLRQVRLGIKNAKRLLPLAKRLTLDALQEAQVSNHLKRSRLLREKRLINAVSRIVLDPVLGSTAGVSDENLTQIDIGSDYAYYLTSDDETIFLLGHELTHVAARSGRLKQFIKSVTETAQRSAGVEPTEEQKEDLACDYIGAEVLKRFIALSPTADTETERFSRALGYQPVSQRLAFAWEDFCASYNGDARDIDHLSLVQTIRALFVLDPEFKALMPQDSISSPLCH